LAAATHLLKSQQILPGARTLVAGSGPLLYAVAAAIISGGGKVVAIADLCRRADWMAALPALVGAPALLGRGLAWLDTGTHDSLLDAAGFIATLQKRQGLMVACPEEIAYRHGWISAETVQKVATQLSKNSYGQYLYKVLNEHNTDRGPM
jgi:hypothetical protein